MTINILLWRPNSQLSVTYTLVLPCGKWMENSAQDFARDQSSLVYLPTLILPPHSLTCFSWNTPLITSLQIFHCLLCGSQTKSSIYWSHAKFMTTHGTSSFADLLLDLPVIGKIRGEDFSLLAPDFRKTLYQRLSVLSRPLCHIWHNSSWLFDC